MDGRMEHTQEHRTCQHRFSLKNHKTPPSKDKSISGRRADGFEGRACPCLRWEASPVQHAAVKWNPCDSPMSPPKHRTFQQEPLMISDILMWSVQLTEECKRGWLREESRGRVNISYTYYQTELQISIPSKPPQVMLNRLCGNQGGCEFLLKKGDPNLNKLIKKSIGKISKAYW